MNCFAILVLGAGLVLSQENAVPRKLFVGGFGNAEGASELRTLVIDRLNKSRGVTLVSNSVNAEFILTGIGEISRQERYPAGSSEPRIRTEASLKAELKTADYKLVWAGEIGPFPVFARSVAGRAEKKVVAAIQRSEKR